MNWTISYNESNNIIYVVTEGEFEKSSLNLLMKDIIKTASPIGSDLVIIDHRKAIISISVIETFERPYHFEKSGIPRNAKIAMIYSKETSSEFSFLETVFVNRGFQLKVFKNIEQAESWLLES